MTEEFPTGLQPPSYYVNADHTVVIESVGLDDPDGFTAVTKADYDKALAGIIKVREKLVAETQAQVRAARIDRLVAGGFKKAQAEAMLDVGIG